MLLALLLSGWGLIVFGALAAGFENKESALQVRARAQSSTHCPRVECAFSIALRCHHSACTPQIAANAFVGFEYAHQAKKIPPRALEPFIALTLSTDEDDGDAAMHFTEQMLVLLRRASAIPGDSVPEARGAHFKRMRTMSRIQKQAFKLGVDVATGVRNSALTAAVMVESQAGCCGLLNKEKQRLKAAAANRGNEVNVRVQFQTAWALANLASGSGKRGREMRSKILDAAALAGGKADCDDPVSYVLEPLLYLLARPPAVSDSLPFVLPLPHLHAVVLAAFSIQSAVVSSEQRVHGRTILCVYTRLNVVRAFRHSREREACRSSWRRWLPSRTSVPGK